MSKQLSEIDLNIISSLVYLDIKQDGEDQKSELADIYGQRGEINLGTVIDYYLGKGKFENNTEGKELLAARFTGESEQDQWIQLLKELDQSETTDYRSWKIKEIVNENIPLEKSLEDKTEHEDYSGFVAYTIEVEDGMNVVSFRGSEPLGQVRHLNDWENDLNFFCEENQTEQEKRAQTYIQDLEIKGISIDYITGHSLGGHLALYAAMVLSVEQQEQLKQCLSFAAPGFNQGILDRYRDVIARLDKAGKMKEIQNEMDPVGSILFNPTVPDIICSNDKDAGNFANHSNFLMQIEVDENGHRRFARSSTQQKHILCELIYLITTAAELLPQSLRKKLIDEVMPLFEELTYGMESDENYIKRIMEKGKHFIKSFLGDIIAYAKKHPARISHLITLTATILTVGIYAVLKVASVGVKMAVINQFINDCKVAFAEAKLYLEAKMIQLREFWNGIKDYVTDVTHDFFEQLKQITETAKDYFKNIREIRKRLIQYVTQQINEESKEIGNLQEKLLKISSDNTQISIQEALKVDTGVWSDKEIGKEQIKKLVSSKGEGRDEENTKGHTVIEVNTYELAELKKAIEEMRRELHNCINGILKTGQVAISSAQKENERYYVQQCIYQVKQKINKVEQQREIEKDLSELALKVNRAKGMYLQEERQIMGMIQL